METFISLDTDLNVIFENEAIEYSDDDKIALLTEAVDAIKNRITTLRYDYLHSNKPVDP